MKSFRVSLEPGTLAVMVQDCRINRMSSGMAVHACGASSLRPCGQDKGLKMTDEISDEVSGKDKCPSCGIPYVEHVGLIPTCAEVQRLQSYNDTLLLRIGKLSNLMNSAECDFKEMARAAKSGMKEVKRLCKENEEQRRIIHVMRTALESIRDDVIGTEGGKAVQIASNALVSCLGAERTK